MFILINLIVNASNTWHRSWDGAYFSPCYNLFSFNDTQSTFGRLNFLLTPASAFDFFSAGILYINPADLGWNPQVASWIDGREIESEKANLTILFDKYLPSCLDTLKTRCCQQPDWSHSLYPKKNDCKIQFSGRSMTQSWGGTSGQNKPRTNLDKLNAILRCVVC